MNKASNLFKQISSVLSVEARDVDEWANKFRYIGRGSSARPGKWKTSLVPYSKEIMKAYSDPTIREVVVVASSQVSKSEGALNAIGYFMDVRPTSILIMQPTLETAEDWSSTRLSTMIRDTPRLRNRMVGQQTIYHKDFIGGYLTVAGSNSPATLAGKPIQVVIAEDIDRMQSTREGDPIHLARARTKTFPNSKIIMDSTPTDSNSRIMLEYEKTNKQKYAVKCPKCKDYFIPEWKDVKWERDKNNRIKSVYIECQICKKNLVEKDKKYMIKNGKWIAEKPHVKEFVGFQLNELVSPFTTWESMVTSFLDVKSNPEQFQVWVNTSLGEKFDESKQQAPEWESIKAKSEIYDIGYVPTGVKSLIAGVDIQLDRIEVSVVGYGNNGETWQIEHLILQGQTDSHDNTVYAELSEVLYKEYKSVEDKDKIFTISSMGIDTGFRTQEIYKWSQQYPRGKVILLKGAVGYNSDIIYKSKIKTGNHFVYYANVSKLKLSLYSKLRLKINKEIEPVIIPSGYCHFPFAMDDEFFKQLVSEKLEYKATKGGFKRIGWVKKRDRNEALDCRVYCSAVSVYHELENINTQEEWDEFNKLAMKSTPKKSTTQKNSITEKDKKQVGRRIISKGISNKNVFY